MIGWLAVLVVAIALVIQVIPVERNVSTRSARSKF